MLGRRQGLAVAIAAMLAPAITAPAAADDAERRAGTSASTAVTVTGTITDNRVEEHGATHSVKVEASLRGNSGIVSVNQASGSLNMQSNQRAVAYGGGAGANVTTNSVAAAAKIVGNRVVTSDSTRQARIASSFQGTVGVVGVNQSAGNLNRQSNVLTLSVGFGEEATALGETDLGVVTGDNKVERQGNQDRSTVITDSFGGFRGAAQVTQSAGDGNIVNHRLGLSVQVLR